MLLKDHINLGKALTLHSDSEAYLTKLLDFVDESGFITYRPTHQLRLLQLEEGQMVRFYFNKPDGLYSFFARFTGSLVLDKVPLYRFEAKPPIDKSQRRRSFRLYVTMPLMVHTLPAPGDDLSSEKTPATTVNLSENGVLFACDKPYMLGKHVIIHMVLDEQTVHVDAHVVRCQKPMLAQDPYRVAVQFEQIPNQTRKTIAQYILRRQVLRRQQKDRDPSREEGRTL